MKITIKTGLIVIISVFSCVVFAADEVSNCSGLSAVGKKRVEVLRAEMPMLLSELEYWYPDVKDVINYSGNANVSLYLQKINSRKEITPYFRNVDVITAAVNERVNIDFSFEGGWYPSIVLPVDGVDDRAGFVGCKWSLAYDMSRYSSPASRGRELKESSINKIKKSIFAEIMKEGNINDSPYAEGIDDKKILAFKSSDIVIGEFGKKSPMFFFKFNGGSVVGVALINMRTLSVIHQSASDFFSTNNLVRERQVDHIKGLLETGGE